MSAPDEAVVDEPVDVEPVIDQPIDEPAEPVEPSTSAPAGLDAELLAYLGFDLDDVETWWLGRESWPSPLRTLIVDLEARGVETIEGLTEKDKGRLRVADRVSEVQEGYRRRFVRGMPRQRPGGWSIARHHDERRVW